MHDFGISAAVRFTIARHCANDTILRSLKLYRYTVTVHGSPMTSTWITHDRYMYRMYDVREQGQI